MFRNNWHQIKNVRQQKGFNIKEISQKTGIEENYIKKIEEGSVKQLELIMIIKILKYFNIEPSYFFGLVDDEICKM